MDTLSIGLWWEGLNLINRIYWIVAIPATIFFVIQIVMTFVGADTDVGDLDTPGDVDASIDADAGIGFQLISLKNFIGFLTIFGWSGIACLDSDLSIPLTVLISTVSGVLMMVIMATIFYFMGKLVETGNVVMDNAVGKTGTVYLPIGAQRATMGKIQIQHHGFQTLDAITDEPNSIPTGTLVQVVGLVNDTLLLVKPA